MTVVTNVCPACDEPELGWFCHLENTSGVVDGRLRMHEVRPTMVQGCGCCGHTVRSLTIEEFLDLYHIKRLD